MKKVISLMVFVTLSAVVVLSAAPAVAGTAAYVNPNGIDGYDNPLAGGAAVAMAPGHVSMASATMDGMSIVFENSTPAYIVTGTLDSPVKNDQAQQQLDFMYGNLEF